MELVEKIGNHAIDVTDKGLVWWTYNNGWSQTGLHRGHDGRWYTDGGVPIADSYQRKVNNLVLNALYRICKGGE